MLRVGMALQGQHRLQSGSTSFCIVQRQDSVTPIRPAAIAEAASATEDGAVAAGDVGLAWFLCLSYIVIYIESSAFTRRIQQLAGAAAMEVLSLIQDDLLEKSGPWRLGTGPPRNPQGAMT